MWRTQRATSEAAAGTAGERAVRQQHSAPADGDGHHQDAYEVHRIAGGSSSLHPVATHPPSSPLSSSAASNVSASSFELSARQRQQRAIASAFFGPSSQATDIFFETDQEGDDVSYHDYYSHTSDDDDDTGGGGHDRHVHKQQSRGSSSSKKRDSRATSDASSAQQLLLPEHDRDNVGTAMSADEAAVRRRRRKENQEKFKRIARLADAHRPVSLSTFTRKSTRELTRRSSSKRSLTKEQHSSSRKINTELLEAYVAYSRSIGREPQIDIYGFNEERGSEESDQDGVGVVTGRASFVQPRTPVVKEHRHVWTDLLGTRHSKRRGCLQFWVWLCIGIVVSIIMAFFLASLSLNEVLHLDAFIKDDVAVTDDFTYLYLRDEVTFRIKYDISSDFTPSSTQPQPGNDSYFQVLLLYDFEFDAYVDGEPFNYIAAGSTLRTTYASLPLTTITNDEQEEVYFVVQPCVLPWNPGADYCQTKQLPTAIDSGRKVYKLKKSAAVAASGSSTAKVSLSIKHLYVNPMPNTCSDSGWQGGWYLIIFLPYVVLALFGLRVFQMLFRCESFSANLERKYQSEFDVPENEVDYWQPMPWDRKVPKTRLLGPCCWKKMRKPFEPFYTWWRHENYFTWIFFPYRNERLARGERALIVFCSLYLTFYVLFVLVMLRDAIGSNLSVAVSVLVYYVLIMILPSLGKAIFKEIFKLIFRQRRKYFRVKAAGGDTQGFSFRLAFFLQFLVAVLITCTQLPMAYIWLYRSCEFLKQFMYFGVLAAVTRLSILGLLQDYAWYLVIKTWGWRDLCPYCTERLVHCDCFNDELLVLSVERVGPKWELIMLLDKLLAKQSDSGYTAQFDQYTPEQLRERWQVLVDRAEKHMEKVEKLRAYQEKKRLDRLRRERHRASFMNAASFLSFRGPADQPTNGGTTDVSGESASGSSKRRHKHRHDNNDHHNASHTEEDEEEQLSPLTTAESQDAAADLSAVGGCCLREKKVLALNSKIELDKFEKHYDSTIGDVFHSIQSALSRRRRHGAVSHEQRREERRRRRALHHQREGLSSEDMLEESDVSDVEGERDTSIVGGREDNDGQRTALMTSSGGGSGSSNSNGSNGETMWIFDSPRERLKRRELEKLRRKRAFRVLDDYFIETVEPVAPTIDEQAAPAAPGSASAGTEATPPTSSRQLTRKDSKLAKLLARQKATPREEDVVIVVSDTAPSTTPTDVHVTVVPEEYDDDSDVEATGASVRSRRGVGARVSGYESSDSDDDSVASINVNVPPAPQSRAYAVVERKPSLLRMASTSATSFASWVFKFDKNADV